MGSVQDDGSVIELELQGTGFSELCQDLIGIGHAGDLYVDTVGAFLVYGGFRRIAVDTLLQLVYGIGHVFRGRILVYGLVGDRYAAFQIESELDVLSGACPCGTPSHEGGIHQGSNGG